MNSSAYQSARAGEKFLRSSRFSVSKRRKVKKLFGHLVFWLMSYPSLLLLLFLYFLLVIAGRVRIKNKARLPVRQKNLIIAPNHPSLWEPILLMAFRPWESLLHPIRFIPWSTADQNNYDKWYWIFGRQRFIFIPRGNRRGEFRAMVKVIRVLRSGKRVIIFGEGGRTDRKKSNLLYSKSGRKIRVLTRGLGRVACEAGSTVLPIWIEGAEEVLPIGSIFPRFWKPVTLKIGRPFQAPLINPSSKEDFEDGTQYVLSNLVQELLKLADEEG
jgi:1-acyl-sn-glycerol-3-phosphate acyltransferase